LGEIVILQNVQKRKGVLITMDTSKLDKIIRDGSDPQKVPKTAKGIEMRSQILSAAKTIFGKKGYLGTRICDITQESGISEGNFYRYFNNKDEVLNIILKEVLDDIFESGGNIGEKGTYLERLEVSTRGTLEAYQRNANMYKVFLEVIHFNPKFKEYWFNLRVNFLNRIRRGLEKMNLPEKIDLDYAATALGSMVSHFAYIWLVLDGEETDKEFDMDKAVETLAYLWYNAINSNNLTENYQNLSSNVINDL
jgi:AcrR family transcriptional regulator